MTRGELEGWAPRSRSGFADRQVAAGLASAEEAAAVARRVFGEELPHGLDTPTQHLWCVRAADACAGHLWLRVRPLPVTGSPLAPPTVPTREVEAYVLDLEISPDVRGRGLGRAAMLAGHRVARDLGATVARLTVLGDRPVALGLYRSLGYGVERVLHRDGTLDGGRPVRPVAARLMSRSLLGEPALDGSQQR